jgi:hypothetical protein
LIIQTYTPCWTDPGFSAAYYCAQATRIFFRFSRSKQGLRMIACCYSKLRLLVIGERIIETCSMLGSVLIQTVEYVGASVSGSQFMHRWCRCTYFLRLRTGR